MAWGRRCDAGCYSWPDSADFHLCPICEKQTERFYNLEPLTESEARHVLFDLYYQRHCEERGITESGDLPESYEIAGESEADRERLRELLAAAENKQ